MSSPAVALSSRKTDAAKAAIGYEKPRLAAIEHAANKERPPIFQIITGVPRHNRRDDEPEDTTLVN